jgi:putative hydrolase of the HAD superfamily
LSAFAHIRAWVFDLDNTLYPAPALYDAIGVRMTAHIARALDVPEDEALRLRELYFHQHGATVAGLAVEHGVDPRAFLHDVHQVDYTVLAPDPELVTLIGALPGRRIVFTNGGGGHGQRALENLGLAPLFEHVFDIESSGIIPKPQRAAYEKLIETCGIDPRESLMIEDSARNLEPAHALGFTTALVGAADLPKPPYVDHAAANLKDLLRLALSGETR